MADSLTSGPGLFNQFRIQKRLKPQNYPVQNQFLQRLGNESLHVGIAAMQGFRDNMEDAHCVHLSLSKHTDYSFFGVFDGHNGTVASTWIAEHLAHRLDELESFTPESIADACIEADRDLLNNEGDAEIHGSTAIFALLTKDDEDEEKPWRVIIGNLGDSRLIVAHYDDDEIQQISDDHKPTNEKEEKRIKGAGGFVARGRIDACLAVSRAFGDGSYKVNKDLPPTEQKVSPAPDVFDIRVGPSDFLFICCDGIFESFSNEKALDYIRNGMKTEEDTASILSTLLIQVLQKGSKDNMTAMVVQFKDGRSYDAPDEFVPGEWYEGGNDSFQAAYEFSCEWYGKTLEEGKALWASRKKILDEEAQKSNDEISYSDTSDPSVSSSEKEDVSPPASPKPDNDLKNSQSSQTTHQSTQDEPQSPKKSALSRYAQIFGGTTAKTAIIAATGIDGASENAGTPRKSEPSNGATPARKKK